MIAGTYLQTLLWGKKLIMNELEIKLNDAATVYWAIAKLEQYLKVKVK